MSILNFDKSVGKLSPSIIGDLSNYNKATIILQKQQNPEKALKLFKAEPNNFKEKYLNMGNIYEMLDRHAEARKCFLLANDPNVEGLSGNYGPYDSALGNLGLQAFKDGDDVLSQEYLEEAIIVNPKHNASLWNLSLTLLRNYCSGMPLDPRAWRLHSYRFRTVLTLDYAELWDRYSKVDKIIVLDEQGIGDKVMYGRWLYKLREYANEVVVQCKKELWPIFSDFRCVEKVDELEPGFVGIPFGELADMFNVTGGEYLKGKFAKRELDGFNVMIEWAGNPDHPNDRHRSCYPGYASQLAKSMEGINFHNARPGVKNIKGIKLWNSKSWTETCELIESMNLIVTIDTSLAHVAGAMGKPVLLMQPRRDTDYRWGHPPTKRKTGMDIESNIWYPSVKVLENKGWDDMFKVVRQRIGQVYNDWLVAETRKRMITIEEPIEKEQDVSLTYNYNRNIDTVALEC